MIMIVISIVILIVIMIVILVVIAIVTTHPFLLPSIGQPNSQFVSLVDWASIRLSIESKNGLILPTGQWYAPSAVINDAWYCMVLHGIAWCCMVLHGIALYCMVLHGIAWHCIVLHGIALFCMVLHGIA